MKKNKNFEKETPAIETKEVVIDAIPGSVGEFIEILKQMPSDAKFTLNGTADINGYMGDDYFEGTIYKTEPDKDFNPEEDPFFNYPEDECDCEECDCCDDDNAVMNDYLSGIDNHLFNGAIRATTSDRLIKSPVTTPVCYELQYEGRNLAPNQVVCIDEIRRHNMYIAECMAEMHRREIAALLEYNTQCLAHFGIETNKIMCTIVDKEDELF